MPIEFLHSYLVHPSKKQDDPPLIGGTDIPCEGVLFKVLDTVYHDSDKECNIDISFNMGADGTQTNVVRSLITEYIHDPTIEAGRKIAERLQEVTTNRSGLGLLFLLLGTEGNQRKMVISRFRADNGILAEEDEQSLNVEYIEKVFLKNTKSYKAVIYRGNSPDSHFWDGKAVDKQISSPTQRVSDYWIKDFLMSDFTTTPAAGTRRLAAALRTVLNKTEDLVVKSEIFSASQLVSNLQGKPTSVSAFANRFGFCDKTQQALRKQISSENVYKEQFIFAQEEFVKFMAYETVELSNGAILTALTDKFNEVFTSEDQADSTVQFITRGSIVSRRIKRIKP